MPKRSSKAQDPVVAAKNMIDELIARHDPEAAKAQAVAEGKNPAAVALGKLGGAKGGKARAESLSPRKRKAIARKAARSRWNRNQTQ